MGKAFAGLVEWFRRRRRVDWSQCRLDEKVALEIAARAAPTKWTLIVLRVTRSAQGFVWEIGTATVGSGYFVRVDDATGEVIDSGTWGVR